MKQLYVPYHSGQRKVYNHRKRNNVLDCGRRWGKTTMGAWLVTECAWRGPDALWGFPSIPIAKESKAWDTLRRIGLRFREAFPGVVISEADHTIKYPSGGTVRLRPADDPDRLRGPGLGRAVLDEAALMKRRVWHEVVRPALADNEGDSWFLSTPRGRDWFFELHCLGRDGDPDWQSWVFTSFDNPHFPKGEEEALRREYAAGRIPEHTWRQEYMAEFLESEGSVFRKIVEAATGAQEAALEGASYTIGVDLAKQNDFSTFSVWHNGDRRQVWLERHRHVDYVIQESRLAALADRYNKAALTIETNSAGEPFAERMDRRGYSVRRHTTGPANKGDCVEDFALAIENGDAVLLDPAKCPDTAVQEAARVQLDELAAFQRVKLPSGRYRYTHPDGGHDDTVDAAWIAWTELTPGVSTGVAWI